MGANLADILSPKTTRVTHVETVPGRDGKDKKVETVLYIQHKRLTAPVRAELRNIAEEYVEEIGRLKTEMNRLQDEHKRIEKEIETLDGKAEKTKADDANLLGLQNELIDVKGKAKALELPVLQCRELEYLISDLDIRDGKNVLEPTYENLLKLPEDLRMSIETQIMETAVPEKKSTEVLSTTTPQAADGARAQAG